MIRPRLFVVLLGAILLVWLLGPALVGQSSFAFRDAAHYYHPLFEYLRQEWGAGRVPLWNPYENCGVPLVAENSSSVFYPGKLLFALPLDFTWLYNWYIAGHVVLAGITSYALARRWQASPMAAGCAALAYAASGNVLFQYCNVVFLVGAAWLPLALLLGDRMLCGRQFRAALGLGLVLALMVLGGDPQMAYNAVLLVALEGFLLWRVERKASPPVERPPLVRSRWVLLGVAGLAAGGLAAVQVLPTLEGAPYSGRSRFDSPRNVYELGQALVDGQWGDKGMGWHAGLMGNAPRGHQRQIYQFSVAPWRAMELVWPNVTGRGFPTDRRWLGGLGAEYNVWTPSLYLGLLPVVLALATFSLRTSAVFAVRIASWLVVFGALGSLGHYGVAWLLGVALGGTDLVNVGGEVGGLYWWLCVLLPKYVAFRFPAKLFVVATLGLAMLAALGWDGLSQSEFRRRVRWLLALTGGASLVALAALWYYWPQIVEQSAKLPSEPLLGPFDAAGAWADALEGVLHAAVLATLLLVAFAFLQAERRCANALPSVLLALVALDLAVAQRLLVELAPSQLWRERPAVLARLPDDWSQSRLYRQIGPFPGRWSQEPSAERYREVLDWDRETLWPKFPLPLGVPLVEASQTMASDEYQSVLDVARRRQVRVNKSGLVDSSVLDLLSVREAIVDQSEKLDGKFGGKVAEGMVLSHRPQALQRAWIVHRVEVVPPFREQGNSALDRFTRDLLFPGGESRDWRRLAVVESDSPVPMPEPTLELTGERCDVSRSEPSLVEIEATLIVPGLVVLSDLYYPGWELTVETAGKITHPEILRTNRVLRGVRIEAGTHRLTYRYRPRSVYWGGAISVASALVVGLGLSVARWRNRNMLAKRGHGT